jgi:hypothetical protein
VGQVDPAPLERALPNPQTRETLAYSVAPRRTARTSMAATSMRVSRNGIFSGNLSRCTATCSGARGDESVGARRAGKAGKTGWGRAA